MEDGLEEGCQCFHCLIAYFRMNEDSWLNVDDSLTLFAGRKGGVWEWVCVGEWVMAKGRRTENSEQYKQSEK